MDHHRCYCPECYLAPPPAIQIRVKQELRRIQEENAELQQQIRTNKHISDTNTIIMQHIIRDTRQQIQELTDTIKGMQWTIYTQLLTLPKQVDQKSYEL